MTDVPARWVELAAAALVAHESAGLCRLGAICAECDCFPEERDRGARVFAADMLRPVLADVVTRVEALGHTPECWTQLHERNPRRTCTCWQRDVLALLRGEA